MQTPCKTGARTSAPFTEGTGAWETPLTNAGAEPVAVHSAIEVGAEVLFAAVAAGTWRLDPATAPGQTNNPTVEGLPNRRGLKKITAHDMSLACSCESLSEKLRGEAHSRGIHWV